ncbi:MAG TPA: hypothetical protein VD763_12980, partial [Candidatus Saccharimonadales bacterium]|nr:hypothetical protein [Candidatus Saccharimonadales bacterium]
MSRRLRPWPVAVATLLLVVTGCAGGGGGSTAPSVVPSDATSLPSASAASPAAGSPGTTTAPSASLSADTFQNPVIDRNYADPFVLRDGDRYLAYATG